MGSGRRGRRNPEARAAKPCDLCVVKNVQRAYLVLLLSHPLSPTFHTASRPSRTHLIVVEGPDLPPPSSPTCGPLPSSPTLLPLPPLYSSPHRPLLLRTTPSAPLTPMRGAALCRMSDTTSCVTSGSHLASECGDWGPGRWKGSWVTAAGGGSKGCATCGSYLASECERVWSKEGKWENGRGGGGEVE